MNPVLSAMSYNTEGTKYAVVIILAPFWIPFIRELWREFNEMLAEEGGLFGRTLTEEEVAEIRARQAEREASMVTELKSGLVISGGAGGERRGGAAPRPGGKRPGARRVTGGPRGFAAADTKRRRKSGFR